MTLTAIPKPTGYPLVGNALQIPPDHPNAYFFDTAARYPDGIYELNLLGRRMVFVYDPELVAEACDQTRFRKSTQGAITLLRELAHDGLFTADADTPLWGQAHRILMPAFSQRSMTAYYPQMLEVAQQLVASWRSRQGQDLNVPDDMTRLTLDTIALTGFDYRFRSFDSAELHPFLQAMGRVLTETMHRLRQPPLITKLKRRQEQAYQADIATMQEMVDAVIRRRRADPADETRDLLGLMLRATDPQTGQALPDDNVRDQVLTFLIAGHETTSGLLSFALYNLLRNPHVLARAYAEVDAMLPVGEAPSYETIRKLDVIPRILEETLRIWSPISVFAVEPMADTTIGGRPLPAGTQVGVLLPPLHRHHKAWERPEEFDIDRWLPENRRQHHPVAYKPFGNGERACIGRQFALTEARLALALILRDFAISDPHDYRMQIKETLTLKPSDFTIRVRERGPHERVTVQSPQPRTPARTEPAQVNVTGVGLTVAYGSNVGTCADIAERLAERAGRSGFTTAVTALDAIAAAPPAQGLLVVVTSTYNGKAPDNAQAFDALAELPPMPGVRIALLGCGNTQWPTYQAFPRRAWDKFTRAGAVPIIDRGEAAVDADFDGDLTAWTDALWTALAVEYGTSTVAAGPRYEMQVLSETDVRPSIVSAKAVPFTIISTEELTSDPTGLWDFSLEAPRPGVRSIVAALPEGVTYTAGDHLAVYAKNDPALVERALRSLNIPRDQVIRLNAQGTTHLPTDTAVTAGVLLTEFVELQETATRADLDTLAAHTGCPHTRAELGRLDYTRDILAKRVSVLNLLERFPAITLPFPTFLEMTGPIKPRYYSISSSPLADPGTVRVTVGLVEGPAWSGDGQYRGMCSAYLAGLTRADVFYGHVRVPTPPFRLPQEPSTPIILIGPGTGFAPLRGFIEERALSADSGPIEVFTGCRHPDHDWLYRGELEAWQHDGVVRVHTAFSAVPGHPYRLVQDAIAGEADTVWDLLDRGAHVFLCGDGLHMAPAVRRALADVAAKKTGEDGDEWLRRLDEAGRFQQDIFA